MDTPRLDPRAARVVAWHNRHPLARRITAAQVRGLGHVAVPFFADQSDAAPAAPGPASVAAAVVAQAQARAASGDGVAATAAAAATASAGLGRLRAAFTEDFIAAVSRRAAARFVARHGMLPAALPVDGPIREVAVATASPRAAVVWRVAGTAAIEVGERRVRVLLAPAPEGAVLGRRLLDPHRVAAVWAASLTLVASIAWAWLPLAPAQADPELGAVPVAVPVAVLVAVPVAVSAAAAATANAPEPETASAPQPAREPAAVAKEAMPAAAEAPAAGSTPAPAPSPAPSAASAAAPGPDAAPASAGAVPAAAPPRRRLATPIAPRPSLREALRPPLDEATKEAARKAVADLRAARALPAGVAAVRGPEQEPQGQAQPAGQPLFALSTRILRTQAESEQLATAARALLSRGAAGGAPLQVELLQAGADWRVVAWPFSSSADAERARARLASRGVRVHVVAF